MPSTTESQVTLNWTAATDNVGVTATLIERCSGTSCVNFAQIASVPTGPAGTTYTDTDLAPAASFSYRIRATDAAGNLGPYSSTVTATTGVLHPGTFYTYDDAGRLKMVQVDDGSQIIYTLDPAGNRLAVVSTAPTPVKAPPAPGVAPASATSMSVSWNAATGGSETYTYTLYRGGTAIRSGIASNSFVDTGLVAHTSYSYAVAATDSDGNVSPQSAAFSNYTYAQPVISTFSAVPSSDVAIGLSWTATDTNGPGLSGFSLYRGSTLIASPSATTTSYADTGLVKGTSYTYTLIANDGLGDTATATAMQATYAAPAIASFTATATSSTSLTIAWSASDTNGPGGLTYALSRNGTALPGATSSPYSDTGLAGATTYTYTLTATDSKGDPTTVSVNGITLPGLPGTATFNPLGYTTATAFWTAPTPPGMISGYQYSLASTGPWTPTGSLTAQLTGLASATPNTLYVEALNSNNLPGSPRSTLFTTLPAPMGPLTPTSEGPTSELITWDTETGSAISGYQYQFDSGAWTLTANKATSITFNDLGPGTYHTVSAEAVDVSGTGASSSLSFWTVPSAPPPPEFSEISNTSVTVTFRPAAGITTSYQYNVSGTGWKDNGTIGFVILTGLTQGTSYSVQVRAVNLGGAGPASLSSSFKTPATDTPTMNVAEPTISGFTYIGFENGAFGSMTPTTTSNGYTYVAFYDRYSLAGQYAVTEIAISGFTSDPGQGWLAYAGTSAGHH